jgi:hypothetical protein
LPLAQGRSGPLHDEWKRAAAVKSSKHTRRAPAKRLRVRLQTVGCAMSPKLGHALHWPTLLSKCEPSKTVSHLLTARRSDSVDTAMSTLAYNALTKQRQQSPAIDDRGKTSVAGVKQYVDAAAALVPAEVLAFHVFALQLTTKTIESVGKGQIAGKVDEKVTTAKGENVAVITDPKALKYVFIALVIGAAALYAIGHWSTWEKADWFRMAIPPAAFVVWTMLQKATAFDAVAPGLADTPRALIAAGAAVVLGIAARELAFTADKKGAA